MIHQTKLVSACLLLLVCFLTAGVGYELRAALWLPHSLSDHILFQQAEPIVLWGKAAPHSTISTEIDDENSGVAVDNGDIVSDADGRWKISLKPLNASFKKYTVKITGDGDTRFIHDALVGELWLSGGQSNMAFPVRRMLGGEEIMAAASQDNIRIFYQQNPVLQPDVPVVTPVADTVKGSWLPATSGTNVADCSGVAYTFALALYDDLNKSGRHVPVGVMNTAVGSTGVEAWMSRSAMESDPLLKARMPTNWNAAKWEATTLFNLKIAPLTRHAVRGFIWYQGENNASGGVAGAVFYKQALSTLIADWRQQWGGQMRPFILSQLAALDDEGKMPLYKLDSLAMLREAQFEVAQTVPQTAAIPIHDLPKTWNIGNFGWEAPVHPLDKKPIGQRMALAARALAYGEVVEYLGPVFDHLETKGDKAMLHFQNAQGLNAGGGGPLIGFAVCNSDRRFVEAEARIIGKTVEVASVKIKDPVAVTYAFTAMNHSANLFNGLGLPAYPFRTDKVKSDFLKGCTDLEAAAAIARQAKINPAKK